MLGAVLVTLACLEACIPDGGNGKEQGAPGVKTGQSTASSCRKVPFLALPHSSAPGGDD